jgi:hypothetical protein
MLCTGGDSDAVIAAENDGNTGDGNHDVKWRS